jgi:hypothetical protein
MRPAAPVSLIASLILLICFPSWADMPPTVRPTFPQQIQGITISTHGSGADWGSDAMRPTMTTLSELGANWVTIHPYAGIRADGSVRFRPIDPENPPQSILRPIREAHQLGLKILIKPHLAYWGSPFAWRGDIRFDDPAAWDRFFNSYSEWIIGLAAVARDADGFVVGTELGATVESPQNAARWKRIITEVRKVNRTPLTYAANWDRYQQVPFWKQLDAIGIQAYFPLIRDGETTTEERLRSGWQRWTSELRRYSEESGRPVLFTELGYNHSQRTAIEPWSSETDDAGEATQELCTRIALQVVSEEPAIIGSFLWKWFPEPRSTGRNFRLATPTMRRAIRDAWQATTAE